ncbi:MAG: HAMP domain-containing histidine kinase [Alphaproteobacteria bacterium]|nr:HAMP domain-containing histidine kinase [Alphaproteobacteria bacterium]
MRAGHSRGSDIPDFSERHDEIGELSVVLRNMTETLWSRMDRIERFAAEVAHELKNPLTSLKSAAETAGRVKKKDDLEKLLGIIVHDADRMSRLISDISAASRLDTSCRAKRCCRWI